MKDLDSLKTRIKEYITLGALLKQRGLIFHTLDEEQFSCPFHGIDRKKSARYYRSTDTAYCWVCKEKWDIFSFVRKRENIPFAQVLKLLIQEYHVDIKGLPEATESAVKKIEKREEPKINNRTLQVERLSQAIMAVRGEIDMEAYRKFVYSYLMLKYVVSDDKFPDYFDKLKKAMFSVFERSRR